MPELARAAIALPIIFAVAGCSCSSTTRTQSRSRLRRLVRLVAIGFGPKLIERVDRRGTTWRIALVPIRGYVALHPDTVQAGHLSFRSGPVWVRLVVTAAGPAANLILTAFLVSRPGAHQSPAHVDARWRRNPGRPCRADCAGVPHHRPRSLSPTAPVHPSWRHSSLPPACTISWPLGKRRPQSISKIGRCEDRDPARCSVDQARHGTARSSCRRSIHPGRYT